MTKKDHMGMWLRQTSDPQKRDTHWLIQGLVALPATIVLTLLSAGLIGFESRMGMLAMAATAAASCALYAVLLKGKQEKWFYVGLLSALLLMTLVFRQQMLEGFRICWNQAGDAVLRGTGWVIGSFALKLDPSDGQFCTLIFGGMVSCAIALLCCLLVSFAPVILAILPTAVALTGMTLLQMDGDFLWWFPALTTSVVTLVYCGWRKKAAFSQQVLSWSICALVVAGLIAFLMMPGVRNWAEDIRNGLRDELHAHKYETKYHSLPEGDFTDYHVAEREAEPALVVTMEMPHTMYLRGYTAATFTGLTWEPLDRTVIAENRELLHWLNRQEFDLHSQFDAAAAFAQLSQSNVTVQNIGACSFYRYVPFSIGKGEWTQADDLNADGVHGNGLREYTYSVWLGNGETITQVLTLLQTSDDPIVMNYRKAESAYRQFVYQQYLDVPDEVKELLQEAWNDAAAPYGISDQLTQQQAQESAFSFLRKCFPEGGTPADLQLPLQTADGTVYQYVTVAVLTLRYFGIPARYAEGYVITDGMVSGLESGATITVDSSCATAWVEVYQDGIGWIPMDLTPGMGQKQEPSDEKEPNEDPNSPNEDTSEEPEEQEPEKQEQPEPEPIGGTMVRILKTLLKTILLTSASLIALFLLLWGRRRLVLRKRSAKFQNENSNDAIAWIYADAALLLEKLGFHRCNGSMRSLRIGLEEMFGPEFGAQFELATDLNDRALFSSRPLDPQQRSAVQDFHDRVVRELHGRSKWYRRMWRKWVLCLY